MAINLATKWKAGSAGDDAEYSEARLIDFRIGLETDKYMVLAIEFGDMVGGQWVKGATGHFKVVLKDTPEATPYTDFMQANGPILKNMGDALYAKLQELEPVKLSGSIT